MWYEYVESVIGKEQQNIQWWQVTVRTIIMFFEGLILVHIAGIRTFGRRCAIDNITIFVLGSLLASSVLGMNSLIHSSLAGLIVAVLHRSVAILSYYIPKFGEFIRGKPKVLFKDNEYQFSKLRASNITQKEIMEAIRETTQSSDISEVDEIRLLPGGDLIVTKK
jgi:uncharacterized membrane protein YcaP (DUF421 family)